MTHQVSGRPVVTFTGSRAGSVSFSAQHVL